MAGNREGVKWWTPVELSSAVRALGAGLMIGSYLSVKWDLPVICAIGIGFALQFVGHFIPRRNFPATQV